MTSVGIARILLVLVVVFLLVKPLGTYMAKVYEGERTIFDRFLQPFERWLYRICAIDPEADMPWQTYTIALLAFTIVGMLLLYALQRLQGVLPLNPQGIGAVDPSLAFNTATSFATNTNWQNYGGESTLSDLSQMAGLTVKNFTSAAVGMAVLVALIRGLTRRSAKAIGNFWVDTVRGVLYILMPLAIVLALLLAWQGLPQTLSPYKTATLMEPTSYEQPITDASGKPVLDAKGQPKTKTIKVTEQQIAIGPVASQLAIKELGTNGGGFFNANSAHPYENPTPFSNFLELLAILLIPAAIVYTYGRMVKDTRQGWALLAAMTICFLPAIGVAVGFEQAGNPLFHSLGVDQAASPLQPGGNMEGKEVRFGPVDSALWAVSTTSTSNGSVNSMHDSYTPIAGMVPMVMMHLGEIIYGGVGTGMYDMVALVIVAAFVAGLMVGRTPEYLGKKIEAFEMKMATIVVLVMPAVVLVGTALGVATAAGKAGVSNPGPHGFSEILYAFTSMGNNNGSAFAGLNGNTPFYNDVGAVVMWLGRFWEIVPVLAIAGSLAAKKVVPPGAGTLPTYTVQFVLWLVAVIIILGALSFLPVLALGPIVEHLLLTAGTTFK
ncbi:MAG TPA: potassium-transporting ATPase subunit KdpA [bacterium]|nr:potassium-transporting ATPase subunit KdpA [bacterium]